MSYPHQDLGYRVGGPSPYGEGRYKEKNLARSAMPNLFTYMSSPTREQLDFSTIDPRSVDTRYKFSSADPSKVQQKAPQALCPPDVLYSPATSRILRPITSGSSSEPTPIASHDWIFIHGKSSK